MLVFGRNRGDEIVVPQFDLVVKILAIQGNKVRVGITAPTEVQLFRREVWERLESCADVEPDDEKPTSS